GYDSIRLFVERAQNVKSDFEVTSENAPAIAEICYQLDGLPLAIELAAARVRMFPPQSLLSRLTSRLRLLTGGARDLPQRQRTLRGAIDWSYELLDEEEKALFSRLAVFVGSRSYEAIEAVCNAGGDLDVLGGVGSLIEKSLLRQEEGVGGEPRFVMLETIREYGLERLEKCGEWEAVWQLYVRYYLALAEEAERDPARWATWLGLARLDAEFDNLFAALAWALDYDTDMAVRLCAALSSDWLRPRSREARTWIERVLSLPGAAESPAYPKALVLAGNMLLAALEAAMARTYLEPAVMLLQRQQPLDRALLGRALTWLAVAVTIEEGPKSAQGIAKEGVALVRATGDEWTLADALFARGWAELFEGDPIAARADLEESLGYYRRQGNPVRVVFLTGSLGDLARPEGEYDRAGTLYEEGVSALRTMGRRTDLAAQLHNLAHVAVAKGELARATELLVESVALHREMANLAGIGEGLAGFAAVAAARGQATSAAQLLASATALWESHGLTLWPPEQAEYERTMACTRAQLDHATWQQAWDEGRAMSMERAIERALETE
ncbi:MAG: hypothetical protein M3281_05510, partial [Chloroflexota bacterium]|nr:hypothetical protein [Chloroflexota bacterium]